MRKKILLGLSALAITVMVLPMFAAFEAHVVNVTATIENALAVSPSELNFGTVFPEEVLHKDVNVAFSGSFTEQTGADDVNYVIKQKPKCVDNHNPSVHPQVRHDGNTFFCPEGSTMMPLLCPFLSKHEMTTDGTAQENDGTGIAAFHGPLSNWTVTDSNAAATNTTGRLAKSSQDVTDRWDINLDVPCFSGSCAQDNHVPVAYQLDPRSEHALFGCDLWLEVTGVSRTGTLTVNKVVANGAATPNQFSFSIDGGTPIPFEADGSNNVTVSAGAHVVTEPGLAATYGPPSFGGGCDAGGNVTVPPSGTATCTITNSED